MCGIAGYMNLDRNRPAEANDVARMCDTIVHRGPNDMGLLADGPTALGMRRLSIIDIASGHQPIANEDETVWIVFNGEIYNHNQLRSDLQARGHRFRTTSDTETILHLYEDHGSDCVQSLRGMFAFAIWDTRDRSLFIARDRLGIKPLFYSQTGGRLAFASEMKALLTLPTCGREPDWNAFDAYFTYTFIPAPLTIYKDIRKLLPGHHLRVVDGRVTISRYWDVSFADKHRGTPDEIAEGFLDVMGEATTMRLMSEVPLGAFLSGGVDSGLVVGMMSGPDRDAVNTFTIGFGGQTGDFLDERPYARLIADRYHCRHRELEVVPRISEAIDATVRAFDEPFADDSVIPTYHICEEAKKHVTVILTGLGGDENFAGYERYLGLALSDNYSRLPRLLRQGVLGPLARSLPETSGGGNRIDHLKRFVAGDALEPARRYQSYQRALDPARRRALYAPDIAKFIDFESVEKLGWQHFARLDEGDVLDRALYQDLMMYLPDDILALSDRIGMQHSLELRVPFIDHKVVEYCARIPSGLKINRFDKKHLLKKAARRFLPDSVIDHRKQGFSSPMAIWLRGELRASVDQCLDRNVLERQGIFAADAVSTLAADHYARKRLNHKTIFSLMMFNKWAETGLGS